MYRQRTWLRLADAATAALLALAAILLAVAPARAQGSDASATASPAETMVLAASLNGEPATEPVMVRRLGDRILMAARDLVALGVPRPGSGEVSLADIRGLRWTIDRARQTIDLQIDTGVVRRLSAGGAAREAPEPLTPAGWGGIVGYDASMTRTPRRTEGGMLVDASLYTPAGYAFATVLGAAGDGRPTRINRLQTGFTMTDPAQMHRLTLGDHIAAATAFSRPVRLGGVQFGTDFSLRPDLVTFPVPSVNGAAAVPSTVDLIVNGSRRAAGEVRAGQFAVADVPVQAGVNTITVAVRDALGRETLQTVSTYASRALLRPGLSAFSLEAGAVRVGYGSDHDRYGALAWSSSVRHGVSNQLTIEGHSEGSRRLATLGGGATLGLGVLGQIDLSAAVSYGAEGTGTQFGVGFERIGGRFSVVGRYQRTSDDWRDLASRYGAVTRAHSLLLNLGFDLGRLGTASAGLIDLGRGRIAPDGRVDRSLPRLGPLTTAASTLATGSYSVRLANRFSLLATGGADLRRRRSFYASIGVIATFGARTTSYAGATARSGDVGAVAELGSNAVLPGQVGYRVTAARGAIDRIAGAVDYQGSRGHVGVELEHTNGQSAARASARGSIVFARDGVFLANSAVNSVAIVDTNGQAGVSIYRDNRLAGVTDRRGKLIVTNLSPFLPTKISIEPAQVSDNFALGVSEVVVRPPERAGVRLRFDLERAAALLVQLVDPAGRPLPAGGRARTADGADLPIGMDGEIYLARPLPTNRIMVTRPDGRYCVANFAAPPATAAVTSIGSVRCDPFVMASQ